MEHESHKEHSVHKTEHTMNDKPKHEPHKKEHESHKEHKPWEPKSAHKPVHHAPKSDGSNKFMIMAVLLGLLIIVAGVQAVELTSIKTKIADGSFASAGSSGSSGNSGSTLKNNLDSLPTMVGGC